MIFGGFLVAIAGGAVASLPWWLPELADVTAQPGAFGRVGQVGGALIGGGMGLVVLGLRRRRR